MSALELLDCPFCGNRLDIADPSTMHMSGTWWRRYKNFRRYVGHADRKEGDKPCWCVNCPEQQDGCGARMGADSRIGVVRAWNTRAELRAQMKKSK